jgi:hypothetical protein
VHVDGPGAVSVPPPMHEFSPFVGTVTEIVALVALRASRVNETPPAGSVNVCPTLIPSKEVLEFDCGLMSRSHVRRPMSGGLT